MKVTVGEHVKRILHETMTHPWHERDGGGNETEGVDAEHDRGAEEREAQRSRGVLVGIEWGMGTFALPVVLSDF